jgi:hypothetical protein
MAPINSKTAMNDASSYDSNDNNNGDENDKQGEELEIIE